MQIQNSRFHKVWEIEDKGNFKKIKFSDSKKDKEGKYINCTWSGIIVGKAKDIPLNVNDKFDIISGQVFSDKVGDKWFTNVTIFDLVVTESKPAEQGYDSNDFASMSDVGEDSVPF